MTDVLRSPLQMPAQNATENATENATPNATRSPSLGPMVPMAADAGGLLDPLRMLPDPVFALDRQGRFTTLSPAWGALTGLSVAGSLGRRLLEMVEPEDRADVRLHLDGLFAGLMEAWRAAFRLALPSGAQLWIEAHAAPVAGREGRVEGVLGTLRDATATKRREDELARRALLDPVLGIPNRMLLLDRLRRRLARAERRSGPSFALVLLDLDDFKSINDELGHLAGDEALRTVAQRLVGVVRGADTVARFGGDEFVVLLDEVTGVEGARALTRRMRDDLMEPVDLEGHRLCLSGSFGIFVLDAAAPPPAVREVLACADQAMYRAKRSGSGIGLWVPATPGLGWGAEAPVARSQPEPEPWAPRARAAGPCLPPEPQA